MPFALIEATAHGKTRYLVRRYEAGMEEDFTQVVDIPEPLVIRCRGWAAAR